MKKLAIVGSGIAGLSASYFLKDDFEITLFEKNNYFGGHTNTIHVHDGVKECPVDTGFMVYNEVTYPNLVKLFQKLDVPTKETDMSFSVRNDAIDLEYNGSSLNGLFSQRKNILNLKFLKLIKDILKFNSSSPQALNDERFSHMTIGEYVQSLNLGTYFFDNFLIPMSSAVWSTPIDKMKDFPAVSLIQFFKNHGFVGIDTQLQWRTVVNGSQTYRDKILGLLGDKARASYPVEAIKWTSDKIELTAGGQTHIFDKVIVCSHADEALNLLSNPTPLMKETLSKFHYQENLATVHTDETVMPYLKRNWSSWNFLTRENRTYTVYYMNRLQGVSENQNFFININGGEFVDKSKVIKEIQYRHPVFTLDAVKAQPSIIKLNTNTNLYFAGSYYRYGFHEDALLASVDVCNEILGRKVL